MKHLSTPKLKRVYFRWLKRYWKWVAYDLHYIDIPGPAGLARRQEHVSFCFKRAQEAAKELAHRGFGTVHD